MKIKEGFVLRQVASRWVVLPVGAASVNFNGMVTLNDAGVLLWRTLEKGAEREALADALLAEYDVTREQALSDVDEFIKSLDKVNCIEE
ncbi:MAG: PqqD family protein [Ruminococcaceae bacterium]|nr:PqqD family protein [Oscillospiraceae bacterium]